MVKTRTKNLRILVLACTVLAFMGGLVSYAPTLYQMFCNLTGYGGTVQRVTVEKEAEATSVETVTVYFDSNVDSGLNWEFRPEQRKVEARLGEPTRVNYFARNKSDETVVARATFNVTPYKAAPYFFKIECFCFTEEKLGPGESARMPLVLFIDEEILEDPNTNEVRDITLSYTFYEQSDLSKKEVAEARDLKSGSQKIDATLEEEKAIEFQNDAPRQ